MKKNMRRAWAWVMILCMVLSLVPAAAILVHAADDRTVNGYYENGQWVQGGTGTVTYDVDGTPVELSKTAKAVDGLANTYDVTLKVKTSTSSSVHTDSGAVVLVIDTSSSMQSCANCGQRGDHKNNCTDRTQNRLQAAKAAAKEFLATYAGDDANASRMLAIVTFDGGYRTNLDWCNVAGGANKYSDALSTINGLDYDTGTNMEGGLYLALGLLNDSEVSDIATKNVVLLSDGAPTQRIGNSDLYGSNKADCDAAATQATAIRNTGAKLYTVCFGAARDNAYDDVTVSDFLSSRVATSGCAYDADNASELNAAFKAITESITSGLSGKGWTTSDPMASHIDVADGTGESFYEDGSHYTWELSNVTTQTEGNKTYYIYTYTYRVTFDPQFEGFVEGQYYPTNEETYLNIKGKQYAFPVPGVKATLERRDVTVTKAWNDADNQDGIRPTSVTVQLMEGDRAIGESVVLNDSNNWSYTWDGDEHNLIYKSEGKVHVYTVVELETGKDYTASATFENSRITLTNTHEVYKTAVEVTKVWNDAENQDGTRPTSITVHLWGDGEKIATAQLTAENGWKYKFDGLDLNSANGKAIVYTVTEDAVPGYTTEINGLTITNTHEVEKTEVPVTKVWDDAGNQDGIRPISITVKLFANGEPTGKELTLTAATNWTGKFTDLDKYSNAKEIKYTLAEAAIEGYTSSVSGNTITNTHVPAVTEVSGSKTWNDNDNQDGVRPSEITVNLVKNGEIIASKTVTAADNWSWSFADLPKFENGELIKYTVTENEVDNYSASYNGYNIINTHTADQTSITVTKAWYDDSNRDGKRPNDITVKLLADGVDTGKTLVLNSGNGWTGSFTGLDVNKAGQKITYTIEEITVDGYTTVISGSQSQGYAITNTHEIETVDISGSKTWNDNNDQDGARPDSITIHLTANGEVIDTKNITAADGWSWSFNNLPMYEAGEVIEYAVVEEAVEDYSTTYNGYNITNTHTPEQTSVTVTKSWQDKDDQDGLRSEHITVKLLANGQDTSKTLVLNKGNNWTGSFTELEKYADGEVITYTVEELNIPGYVTIVEGDQTVGYTLINTHEPETVAVSGTKTWNDNGNQDGKRPASITINLLADGVVIETVTVTEKDGWSWSFENLPKFKNHGTEIIYTVTEDVVDEYVTEINGFNATNTHAPEKTSVTVTKAWADSDDQDGLRPNDITVELVANGEATGKTLVLNQGNSWTGTFTDLNKFESGEVITYTVAEIAVEGYETVITGDQLSGYTITNSHTPATVSVSGSKTWNDNNDQDGARPDSIKVHLLKNGEVIDTQTVTGPDWSWSFVGLPQYENHGTEITYSVKEEAVEGYTSVINGYNITNTHAPEKLSVNVVKTWLDDGDQDGIRPNDITVELVANGEPTGKTLVLNEGSNWIGTFTELDKYADGAEIVYSVKEIEVDGYNTVITGDQRTGYTITNSHNPETVEVKGTKTWNDNDNQDGKRPESITINLLADGVVIETVTVTEENGWSWSFENLPKFKNHGTEIIYTVTEDVVDEYVTEINGFNATNTHAPEKTSVTVTKAWADSDDQDGLRPNDITVELVANGEATGKTLVLNQGNSWTGTFTDLNKFESGEVITYTVAEIAVEGYETVITGDQLTGYSITNSHNPELIKVEGTKTWIDADNQDGFRPESITINLLADGKVIQTITVTEADNWSWSFENLPMYRDHGTLIEYAVTEAAVEDYTTTYNGFNVTNEHTPEQTSVTVTKAWADSDDQDGIRPNDITVELVANGEPTGKTLVLNEGSNWIGTFTELDKYADGAEIVYSVKEIEVDGYNTVITGDQRTGYTITNSHNPETVEVKGTKTWNDNDNQDGKRPESITINLLADGVVIQTITVTEADNWSWSFENLPKYRDHGTEIVYTVTEDVVDEYVTEINGFNVTNTHAPEQTSVTVTKAWSDSDDQDGLRPNDITVELVANGEATGKTLVLNQGNSWTGTFTDLNKFESGEVITYTVAEIAVEGYETVITGDQLTGYSITNSHNPELIKVEGTKTWLDNDNQDGFRPESITINLLADGKVIQTITVTEADNWSWSFENLPKYKNHGTLIEYAVTEAAVEDYSTTYNGFDVTNEHTPHQTSVTVAKAWEDSNDQDGIRPNDITVELVANGEATGKTLVLNEGNNWIGTFTELDKYANGAEIVYSVKEIEVDGYNTVITGDQRTGYTITNSHNPETVEVKGTKTWLDNDNQDGKRPASITINLLSDGVVIQAVTVTEADNWSWSFENLPKYRDHGTEIVYTVTENTVDEYVTEINGFNVTNTHAPEKTSVTVTKVWADSDDQDGIRPNDITVELVANGEATGKTLVLNQGNSWTGTFTDLNKFESGEVITYTVAEIAVEGYETVITGDQLTGYSITNSHNPELVKVEGTKTWLDNDNQDGFRPESITINLLADGKVIQTITVTEADNWSWSFENLPKYKNHGTLIEYAVTEAAVEDYSTTYNGFDVTNEHTPHQTSVTVAKAWEDSNDQDGIRPNDITVELVANGEATGKTLVLNEGNNWIGTFTELDKYANGAEIVYSVKEIEVDGYNTVITGDQRTGYTITNSHNPETVEVKGTKTWLDNDNQDGKRPASITINLLSDGVVIQAVTVTEADNWSWSFENLPKYRDHGTEIVYTVTEGAVDEYVTEINGFNVTNTHAPDKTSVNVVKAWADSDNQDGIRPADITVELVANGEKTGKTLVLSVGNNWNGTFTDLDKYADGEVIIYTVEEIAIEGYTTVITGDQLSGYTVTNSHTPETIVVSGTKTWLDNDNQDGFRPESITINLLADGEVIDTVIVTEAENWTWTFENLPKYRSEGVEIVYSIVEEAVEEYSTSYDGFNVTNEHTPEQTSVTVTKAWADNDDQDGIRPESIKVVLLANGEATGETLKLTAENNWTGSFTELDKYADGVEIVYTVEEIAVEGYESVITGSQTEGYVITNSHNPETTVVTGTKTWNDADNQDGVRPEAITINLMKNGAVLQTVTVTEAENWTWTFENLPKYENHGVEIVYSITEAAVEGYTTVYDGFNVTNERTPDETSVTVTKSWVDGNDGDGIRPGSVTIRLLANGKDTGKTLKLSADNNWTGSFTGLAKNAEGKAIVYTVTEDEVKGYNTAIKGDMVNGFVVTNTHTYIPKTGDERSPMLWMLLMLLSGGVLAAAVVDQRKRYAK